MNTRDGLTVQMVTEYVIISDKARKDYGCPGYIQRKMDSPAGTKYIVRVYSHDDRDGRGTGHCLDVSQIESITYQVFRKLLKEVNAHLDIDEKINPLGTKYATSGYVSSDLNYAIQKVIYNPDKKSTTIIWGDQTTTTVRCASGEEFNEYHGFTAAVAKKIYGGTGPIKKLLNSTKTYQSKKKKPAKNSSPIMEVNASENG